MSPLILMITAGTGIALLLFLVLKYKFQPFVALMLVSILVALVAGVKPADLVATIEGGMGKTLGHIAIIFALGAMPTPAVIIRTKGLISKPLHAG